MPGHRLIPVFFSLVSFELLPAVDVADGQAVRLVQGRAGTETTYGAPLDAALAWQSDGAEWIHLVDLDAAFGRGNNAALLAEVVGTLDVKVELSGGIRDDASLAAALATGCTRVNIGTAALENPEWCAAAIARFGDQDRRRAGRPWQRPWPPGAGPRTAGISGRCSTGSTEQGCSALRGHRRDQGRHPARPQSWSCCSRSARPPSVPVIASGWGVLVDRPGRALTGLTDRWGSRAAIVGKALYAGAFTLPQALAAVA